jgi:hypothetical protein
MPKRTTLVLDDKVYEKLVRKRISRYGTARNISKVVNDLVEGTDERKNDIRKLIYSEKLAKTTTRDFEQFRKRLSAKLET